MEVSMRVMAMVAIMSSIAFAAAGVNGAPSLIPKILDIAFLKDLCGGGKFDAASNYEEARHLAIKDLVDNTMENEYEYKSHGVFYSTETFGLAICNGQLSHEDCKRCLEVCSSYVIKGCYHDYEGFVELADCQIHYKRIPFPGQKR